MCLCVKAYTAYTVYSISTIGNFMEQDTFRIRRWRWSMNIAFSLINFFLADKIP